MAVVFAVAVGGALGALSRYGLMTFVDRRTLSIFPWDVFVVNITGCFLVGLVVSTLVDRTKRPHGCGSALSSASSGPTRPSRHSHRTSTT
jgi:fluoride ion exporter CrcB/FEX